MVIGIYAFIIIMLFCDMVVTTYNRIITNLNLLFNYNTIKDIILYSLRLFSREFDSYLCKKKTIEIT